MSDMIDQGWRVYHFNKIPSSGFLDKLSISRNLEIFTYEGKSLLFVKGKFKKQ